MMPFTIRLDTLNILVYDISNYSLFLEKALTFRNVIILIKPVFNQNQNHYYYNIFLEKCSYK